MKAYMALSNIKSLNDDAREITGIATTPETDHVGDVVESRGAKFKLPIPLLWQHDTSKPIGMVTHAKVTSRGIEVRAKIAKSDAPGIVKDRLDEAWQSIKLGLVRGLSIGFSATKSEPLKSGGRRFVEWIWHELSAVVVPANAGASITAIKAADRKHSGSIYLRKRRKGCTYLGEMPPQAHAPRGPVYLRGR
jgi:HK97 family phage prohead protease